MTTANMTFIFLATTILSFICFVSNNYQCRRLLIVIIKEYDFKEATLSSFDYTEAIYSAGNDVVVSETPIMKATM